MDRLLIRNYINDYFNTVLNKTFKPSCFCTYYSLDYQNSVLDDYNLESASYEITGNQSGLVWNKILYLPLFQVEKMDVEYKEDESGVTKPDLNSSFWIPSDYQIQPTTHDFVFFEQQEIQSQSFNDNTFRIKNFKKNWNANITFWNLEISSTYLTRDQIDLNCNKLFVFVDYNLSIYDQDSATIMYQILEKNQNMSIESYFDNRLGYYTF